jgi:hypothetical protein
VSTHEAACPFCAAALPETFRCQPARVALPGRLGRAARIAAGAALMSASCGSGVALYGAPIQPDASADTSSSDGTAAAELAQAPAGDSHAPAPERKKM